MAGKIDILPATLSNIIKGQPFRVTVTVSGETNISANTEIDIVSSPGVHLIKKFPGTVVKTNFIQQMIFLADDTDADYKISFTAKSASSPKGSVDYKPVENPELIPDSCVLRGSSSYLYDPSPVGLSGTPPTSSNPFILASINPMGVSGGSISKYDIQIRATGPVRIFTVDDVEILPYEVDDQKQYYDYLVQKSTKLAVNLKIYATTGIAQFVGFETIFSRRVYNQKQVMFITSSPIAVSDDFDPPIIEETYQSSTLTRPDQPDYFHFMIPQNNHLHPGDFIIGFVTDDDKHIYKKNLIFGEVAVAEDGYFRFKVAYSDMYNGTNLISYAALDQGGNLVGSESNYISYDSGGNNNPSPNDQSRTLDAPEVHDQFGLFIGIYQSINIHSIGNKGIEVWLPVAATANDLNKIAEGDSITIKAYISYCVDTETPARPLPIVVTENHIVQQKEIDSGYYKHTIAADKLLGYDTIQGDFEGSISIDYSRLAQNQKSQLFTRGFDTVAP
ncbi:hypothetical protein [Xenorhabdus bovienii]|uniref:Uncharacterized protein n=1 Tax=Xenorhabdus bovienii str. kraussei Becker Underwood TaxID=1398204 RepID=A0A077PYY1_XENBV|nr:hypothetical protein [Xenorhabdus bovienii]CDH25941.1 hypothetical protein XBKB1_4280002 [Xenorhabdus bovienii str. kraussei Becker Underwood]